MDFFKDVSSTSPISCTTTDPHLSTIGQNICIGVLRTTKVGAEYRAVFAQQLHLFS